MTDIPPERRIAGRLTHWDLDVQHLNHYGAQVGDEGLNRELARLTRQINKTLKTARKVVGKRETYK